MMCRHHPLARLARDGFIAVLLLLFFVDTFPSRHPVAERARAWIDPLLDLTGLWQGPWELFSPEADRENHRLEIVAVEADGRESTWGSSPDWRELGAGETFLRVREVEFHDRVRNPGFAAAQRSWVDREIRRRLEGKREEADAPVAVELRIVRRPLSRPADFAAGKAEPEAIRDTLWRRDPGTEEGPSTTEPAGS